AHESAKRAPTAAKSTPVRSSTNGYLHEMPASQYRHLPPSSSHDASGMLSCGAIGASHDGQCDAGCTTDSFLGTRQMTTLRNEPMMSPKTPQIVATSAVTRNHVRREMAGDCATSASKRSPRSQSSPSLLPCRIAREWRTVRGASARA